MLVSGILYLRLLLPWKVIYIYNSILMKPCCVIEKAAVLNFQNYHKCNYLLLRI